MAENGAPNGEEMHVLIIGAGVTGCLFAQGLKKHNIPYTIFESEISAAHYRPRDWTMGVHWSLPLMRALLPPDLASELHTAQADPWYVPADPDTLLACNGATGEALNTPPVPPTIRYPRRKLRKLMSQGIDIQYDKKFKSLGTSEDGKRVTAWFEDGSSATGTLVVGCNGVQSPIRDLLVGKEEAGTSVGPSTHTNTVVCYGDKEKALFVRKPHPAYYMGTHTNGDWIFVATLDVPSPDDPAAWKFQIFVSWIGSAEDYSGWSNAERHKLIKDKAEKFAEPFRSAVLWMPEDTPVTFDTLHYWSPFPWDNRGGRVTLAGDAAHPMTPHRGQGLNHCINDISNFVSCLQKVKAGELSQKEAVDEFEAEMIPRSKAECQSALRNTSMLHNFDQLLDSPLVKRGVARTEIGEH